MDGQAVQTIIEQVKEPVALDGRTYLPEGWKLSDPAVPEADPLKLYALGALVDYVASLHDAEASKGVIVVQTPTTVELLGPLEGEDKKFRRHAFARAEVPAFGFQLGTYMPLEHFVINARVHFVQSPKRDELISLVSAISESDVRDSNDDGVKQEVTTKRGLRLGRETVEPIWNLAGYRTFREVEQPEADFIVRVRGGGEAPSIALFAADGDAWKIEAVARVGQKIRDLFAERFKDFPAPRVFA